MRVECPHCESKAVIRTSERLSELVREASCICTNHRCGHTFIVSVAVSRTISPSAIPKPGINIPKSIYYADDQIKAQ